MKANWIVAKFGGSSVKDAEAMLRSACVVENNPAIRIVVISATQNTTNQLEFISKAAMRGDEETLQHLINEMMVRHNKIAEELYTSEAVRLELKNIYQELKEIAQSIYDLKFCSPKAMDHLYSIGERMSSLLMADLIRLRVPEFDVELIDARSIIKTNSEYQKAEPQIDLISENTKSLLIPKLLKKSLFVTQGFIGMDLLGHTTTLGREGSDYSAALFGEAIGAELVQIWTDVPGVASADPRAIKEAKYIKNLSYDEATALASLGAKVLFPTTLMPTKRKNIPVFVGSSLDTSLGGSFITEKQDEKFQLKAVTLLNKHDHTLLSFIGCHLDTAKDLVDTIKKSFSEGELTFFDLTSVSVSFKVKHENGQALLLKAHSLLEALI